MVISSLLAGQHVEDANQQVAVGNRAKAMALLTVRTPVWPKLFIAGGAVKAAGKPIVPRTPRLVADPDPLIGGYDTQPVAVTRQPLGWTDRGSRLQALRRQPSVRSARFSEIGFLHESAVLPVPHQQRSTRTRHSRGGARLGQCERATLGWRRAPLRYFAIRRTALHPRLARGAG
jgi:hypothetical protein